MIKFSSFTFALLSLLSLCISSCAISPARNTVRERDESLMSGGHRIRVETFAPSETGRYPTVLVLHSSAGTIVGKGAIVDLCRKLAAQGKLAMLVHYYDRTGTIWSGNETITKLWPTWAATVQDAINYAASNPRVQPDSIGLFGYSLGAFLAVEAASQDKRVKAVVEVSGGIFDARQSTLDRVPPTLILHGRADERVSVSYALGLEKTARKYGHPAMMKLYDNEGHVLKTQALNDAMERTLKFFAAHLPPASGSRR